MRPGELVPVPVKDTSAVVVICDISSSMQGQKIIRLRSELRKLWPEVKARLMVFNDVASWVDGGPGDIPEPMGCTLLARALDLAGTVFPSECIVISDGLPQDGDEALRIAGLLPGTISVCFVGDEADYRGAEFMQKLARVGGGMYAHKDIGKNLSIEGSLRGMLALPGPIALGS